MNPAWQELVSLTDDRGQDLEDRALSSFFTKGFDGILNPFGAIPSVVGLQWMWCPNADCRRLIIQIEESGGRITRPPPELPLGAGASPPSLGQETANDRSWFAYPRYVSERTVDKRVPELYAQDYLEASSIVDLSPRMSAVLSRRVVGDLLFDLGGYNKGAKQVEEFINDPARPTQLRENVDRLREMGNFGAHRQLDASTGDVLEVSEEEAEWLLVLDGLFEHFIIQPARDAERRRAFDEKVARAGRRPLLGADRD